MKMEYTITAPHDGEVVDILCREGEQVNEGDKLITFNSKSWAQFVTQKRMSCPILKLVNSAFAIEMLNYVTSIGATERRDSSS